MANVKYVGNDTKKSVKGKVHLKKDNYTACGARIDDNREDWETTNQSVNCEKRGCK